MTAKTHTNRLINEKSPYLQQHAHNPVDWFPWGEEAFDKAREEKKPILLSIGYSACHWCHVMEQESFENESIAEVMNKNFVCIKVDREERPDLDQIYQNALQLFMERGGGWPLTMFLTPEGVPFYGGTYFPPEPSYGMAGFSQVLEELAETYRKEPKKVTKNTELIKEAFKKMREAARSEGAPSVEGFVLSVSSLADIYDREYGGFGTAPKFPSTPNLENLLRLFAHTHEKKYLAMVVFTLTKMAQGGIYDQLGGGFHRYSVNRQWLVPHFEKMLYDNALLVPLYLSVYQITQEPFFKRIAEEILTYVEREMTHPEGGFYATQDADTEGMEGKFFIWSPEEIREVLEEEAARLVEHHYGVTEEGNFEEKNILHVEMPLDMLVQVSGKSAKEVEKIMAGARKALFEAREKRVKPHRDEKILVSWNGMMISAFFKAYQVLGEKRYLEVARKGVAFIFENLYKEGRLISVYKDGPTPLKGYLDDYAFFIAALLDGYESCQDESYIARAKELAETLIRHFWDEEGKGFFFTADDHPTPLHRPESFLDQSIPSGNSVAAMSLLRLYYYTGKKNYLEKAEGILKITSSDAAKAPFGYGTLLSVIDFYLSTPKEILLVSKSDDPALVEWLQRIHQLYLPNRTLAVMTEKMAAGGKLPPDFQEGFVFPGDGQLVARLCYEQKCMPHVRTLKALEEQLTRS